MIINNYCIVLLLGLVHYYIVLMKHIPGDSSETGVLDGVGLWPGGRKCDGDPLLEPLLPFPPKQFNI